MKRRLLLLNLAALVLILFGAALFILSSGKLITNFGRPFPWYFSLVFFVAAIVCSFFAHKLNLEATKQKVRSRLIDRPAMDEKTFGQNYFAPDLANIAVKLRQILARYVDVEL